MLIGLTLGLTVRLFLVATSSDKAVAAKTWSKKLTKSLVREYSVSCMQASTVSLMFFEFSANRCEDGFGHESNVIILERQGIGGDQLRNHS